MEGLRDSSWNWRRNWTRRHGEKTQECPQAHSTGGGGTPSNQAALHGLQLKKPPGSVSNIRLWRKRLMCSALDQGWELVVFQANSGGNLATWCTELTHWKRPWCWKRLKAGGEGDNRGWDGWMASPTRWTWVWVHSGRWQKAGKPGVLQFVGSRRVRPDLVTEQEQQEEPTRIG